MYPAKNVTLSLKIIFSVNCRSHLKSNKWAKRRKRWRWGARKTRHQLFFATQEKSFIHSAPHILSLCSGLSQHVHSGIHFQSLWPPRFYGPSQESFLLLLIYIMVPLPRMLVLVKAKHFLCNTHVAWIGTFRWILIRPCFVFLECMSVCVCVWCESEAESSSATCPVYLVWGKKEEDEIKILKL